jgi:hypothetical protein
MPPKKPRKQEEPWKRVKRRGRILVGQPPASQTHEDRRKKPAKHKKRAQDTGDDSETQGRRDALSSAGDEPIADLIQRRGKYVIVNLLVVGICIHGEFVAACALLLSDVDNRPAVWDTAFISGAPLARAPADGTDSPRLHNRMRDRAAGVDGNALA